MQDGNNNKEDYPLDSSKKFETEESTHTHSDTYTVKRRYQQLSVDDIKLWAVHRGRNAT